MQVSCMVAPLYSLGSAANSYGWLECHVADLNHAATRTGAQKVHMAAPALSKAHHQRLGKQSSYV